MPVTDGTGRDDPALRLRPGAVEWREVDGELIALDREGATYLAGNPTATLLWQALSEGTTRAALISTLTEKFDVDEDRATADVDAFVQELRSRNLLGA